MNLAVTLGSQVTLTSGDPIYSLVVAWALYAIADDLKPNKSYLRQDKVHKHIPYSIDCSEGGVALEGVLMHVSRPGRPDAALPRSLLLLPPVVPCRVPWSLC